MELRFSSLGYSFERGAEVLLTAYQVSFNALEAYWDNCREALIDYQIRMENGDTPEGEWDEDGNPLWTQDQLILMDLEDTKDAMSALRRAFVLALYHHWERYMRRHLNEHRRDHNSLVTAAMAAGINIDEGLARVRDLANLIKHASNSRGSDLLKSWPTLLPSQPDPANYPDWLSLLVLHSGIVHEVAAIVKLSGPRSVLRENKSI